MQKRLWVDYTNHRDHRAWREISDLGEPRIQMYPALGVETPFMRHETMCVDVYMVDRKAIRTLALESVNGFLYQVNDPTYPSPSVEHEFFRLEPTDWEGLSRLCAQGRPNDAWEGLGKRMGFDPMSHAQGSADGQYFWAKPITPMTAEGWWQWWRRWWAAA